MLIDRLPDCYAKAEQSNNYKLLNLPETDITKLRTDISEVTLSTDIAHSSGKTLDLFGEMLGKKRDNVDDTKYKYLLQTQIARNIISGDFNTTLQAIVDAFSLSPGDVTYEDIKIIESDTSGDVDVVKLPLRILIKAGFTISQSVDLIKDILPLSVGLFYTILEGTFEFGENESEYDEEKGFGSLTDPVIGGMLGGMIGG